MTGLVNNELERIWKEAAVGNWRYDCRAWLGGTKKRVRIAKSLDSESIQTPPE
jgi:hypothetical protein